MSAGGRLPGFAGLIRLGYTPEGAWKLIRDATMADPAVRSILEELARNPDGLAALEASRAQWATLGFPAPWAELLEGGADGAV